MDLETLQELNSGFIRSVRDSDVRWFEDHLSGDFVNSNADGSLSGRAQFLERVGLPCPVSGFECEDVRIRILGDVAIVHGRTVYTTADGRAAAGRYTDVYSRVRGRWLCVCADVTRG